MIDIGTRESERLEFKGAGALEDLRTIGRAVVAMLNGAGVEGGEIWIGVRTEHDRAVGFEPIAEPEAARRAVVDHCLDSVDPPLEADELAVDVENAPDPPGGRLLRVIARPRAERRPYAFQLNWGKHFPRRIGDRTLPMSRHEVMARRGQASPPDSCGSAAKLLRERRDELLGDSTPRFWTRVQPCTSESEPAERALDWDRVTPLLVDPALTSSRPTGWIVMNRLARVVPHRIGRRQGDATSGCLNLERCGAIEYLSPMDRLWHGSGKGDEREVHPLALIELTVSLFRLVTRTYQRHGWLDDTSLRVLADQELVHAMGWRLRPYSPTAIGHRLTWQVRGEDWRVTEPSPLTKGSPFRFTARELKADLEDATDRCALRLVEQAYQAFGHDPKAIPAEFDRATARWTLA